MNLRRTVPFVATSTMGGENGRDGADDDQVLLLDRVEMRPTAASNAALLEKIDSSLALAGSCYGADEIEDLVEQQYGACLEYIYSHPVWSAVRSGQGAGFLRAYLLENRHYLAAAPFRMAGGIGSAARPDALQELQARHVVEEADHDRFFENALAEMGCPRDLVQAARPSPVTVEWIHLMRAVAGGDPFAAAVCSGLLEYTAGNRAAVTGWHEHVAASGQLSRSAVEAIFEHVRVDLGLGHGQNWRAAVRAAGVVSATALANVLNQVSTVAEMIVRWIGSLVSGVQGELVSHLPAVTSAGSGRRLLGGEVDGLPVWPAEILHTVVHGHPEWGAGARLAVAEAYVFEPAAVLPAGGAGQSAAPAAPPEATAPQTASPQTASPEAASRALAAPFADVLPARPSPGDLEKLVTGWMRTIDGHRLWSELTTRPTYPLVYGWLVENYHYVAAIWQHCGAGVAACPDPALRLELVHHLEEEFEHGELFRRGIDAAGSDRYHGLTVGTMRPLATTQAFVGLLTGLAQQDWKAYVLAVAYLQLSLRPGGESGGDGPAQRHTAFYQAVSAALPEATPLLSVMQEHDHEDTELGHGDDVRRLLGLLAEHDVGPESIAASALVPQLVWSFLDGVLEHYRRGDIAVIQRIGWHPERRNDG
jgi:pyrroloquinoline quinone (PQQ) biosynthesis protein C